MKNHLFRIRRSRRGNEADHRTPPCNKLGMLSRTLTLFAILLLETSLARADDPNKQCNECDCEILFYFTCCAGACDQIWSIVSKTDSIIPRTPLDIAPPGDYTGHPCASVSRPLNREGLTWAFYNTLVPQIVIDSDTGVIRVSTNAQAS